MSRFHISLAEAVQKLSTASGKRFVELFKHGSLAVELYEPRGTDPQTPHTRDEGYIVVKGNGEFINRNDRVTFSAGDFLFAASGEVHRIENFY